MKMIKWMTAVVAMVFMMGSVVYAENLKVGVIDTQKILALSSYGKAAKAEIQKKGEALTSDLKTRETEIAELKAKIEREGLVMSPEMREEKEREFRIKVGDYQAQEKKAKQEMAQLQMKLSGRIQEDVLEIVDGIGKKGGYTLILDKGTLMYAADAIDISDQVIEIYNKNFTSDMKAGSGN